MRSYIHNCSPALIVLEPVDCTECVMLPTQNTERLELLQKAIKTHQANTYNVRTLFQLLSLCLDLTTCGSFIVLACTFFLLFFLGDPRPSYRPTPPGAEDAEHRRPDVHPRDIHGHLVRRRSPQQSAHQPGWFSRLKAEICRLSGHTVGFGAKLQSIIIEIVIDICTFLEGFFFRISFSLSVLQLCTNISTFYFLPWKNML